MIKRDGKQVFPLQVKVWSPVREAAAEVWYSPEGAIMAGTRLGSRWRQIRPIGHYAIGSITQWRVSRSDQGIVFTLAGNGQQATFSVDRRDFPDLVERRTLSLTLSATALNGASNVGIENLKLTVPRQTSYGSTVHSRWFRPIIAGIGLVGLLWIALRLRLSRVRLLDVPDWTLLVLLAVVTMFAGLSLSRIPGLPADARATELWSTIAAQQGPAAVVGYSLLATAGQTHGGVPYVPMTFPYPPLLVYVFWAAGKVASLERIAVVQVVKMLAMSAVVVGGGVLFALLRRIRVSRAVAFLAAATYMLNPAVLFDAAVWGQTDAFVGVFLLVSLAGVTLGSPSLLLTGALLAALTKQTGALFAPFMLAIGIARVGIGPIIRALPIAVVVGGLTLTPAFLSGMHPDTVYRPTVTKVLALGAAGRIEEMGDMVSQGSANLWVLLTGLEGLRGLERGAVHDLSPSRLFGLTYFMLSRGAFAAFTLVLILIAFRRKRTNRGIPIVLSAAYGIGAIFLLTRVLPRYSIFGVMFTAASLPWLPRWIGALAWTAVSTTTLVSMWGMFALTSVWYPGLIPIFSPDRSGINRLMASAVTSDLGISLGGLLNAVSVFVLLLSILGNIEEDVATR